jgi:IclR family acetate operon transcriptional repressor
MPNVRKPPLKKVEPSDEERYFSRAVAKALEILEILSNARQPMGLNQVSARLKLSKPSVFRLLYTLEMTGYIRRADDGRYYLTHDIRRGMQDRLAEMLLRAARPHLRELSREFRETTGLAMLLVNHIEVIEVFESPQTVRMGNTVGRILQPHASSLGKCIAAFQPESFREHILRSYGVSAFTPNTITDENALDQEFRLIREQGYATDRAETCIDGYCFGAPIAGPDGGIFAAASISLPASRLGTEEYQARLVVRIRETAKAITRSLEPSLPLLARV